jgi:hypothetical protein
VANCSSQNKLIYGSQTGSARSAARIRKACRAQAIYSIQQIEYNKVQSLPPPRIRRPEIPSLPQDSHINSTQRELEQIPAKPPSASSHASHFWARPTYDPLGTAYVHVAYARTRQVSLWTTSWEKVGTSFNFVPLTHQPPASLFHLPNTLQPINESPSPPDTNGCAAAYRISIEWYRSSLPSLTLRHCMFASRASLLLTFGPIDERAKDFARVDIE